MSTGDLIEKMDPLASLTRWKQAGVLLSSDLKTSNSVPFIFSLAYSEVAIVEEYVALNHLVVDLKPSGCFLCLIYGAHVKQVTVFRIERMMPSLQLVELLFAQSIQNLARCPQNKELLVAN